MNILYDCSKSFQIGFEVDYRKTNYISPALDAQGFLFMTQFLWRSQDETECDRESIPPATFRALNPF